MPLTTEQEPHTTHEAHVFQHCGWDTHHFCVISAQIKAVGDIMQRLHQLPGHELTTLQLLPWCCSHCPQDVLYKMVPLEQNEGLIL